MNQTAHTLLLLVLLTAIIPAQESSSTARSAIQFRDTTGTDKTAKIGWTGDAESGHFFVQTPNEGKVLRSNADGIEVDGTVKAGKFSGDGSGLTNLPEDTVIIGKVDGLKDSLAKKADASELSGKADTGWVKEQLEEFGGMADSASVAARLGGKADTGWVKTTVEDAVSAVTVADDAVDSSKIVDGGISGGDINPGTNLTVGDLLVGDNVGIGTTDPQYGLHVVRGGNSVAKFESADDWHNDIVFQSNYPNGGRTWFQFLDSDGNNIWNQHVTPTLYEIYPEGNLGIHINSSGNVGIGTADPQDCLHISGGRLKLGGSGSITENWWEFGLDDGTTGTGIDFHGGNTLTDYTARIYRLAGDDGNFDIINQGNGKLGLYTNNTERVTIFGNGDVGIGGNVGIGTPNATAKLTITNNDDAKIKLYTNGGSVAVIDAVANTDESVGRWLSINPSGEYVGIGTTTPSYALDVEGTIRGANVAPSDQRYKTAVTPLTSSLDKITALQGVTYLWDRASFPHKNFSDRLQIGLIAQEVEKVIPEVVSTDNQGYKSLAYDRLVPVLVEAVKEQKKIVEKQNEEIEQLRGELAEIKRYLGIR